MACRDFTDEGGRYWVVWDVYPTLAQRRQGDGGPPFGTRDRTRPTRQSRSGPREARDMTDSTNPRALQWSSSPSARAKSAVQRSVTQLLDELAPERVLKRVGEVRGPVEQHRTPTGCVLQAA